MLPLINSSYFQNLVEGFTNGVLIINSNGEVYVTNTAAGHTLGYAVEECNGKNWRELLSGISNTREFQGFMDDAATTDRCNLPFYSPYVRPDGQTRFLSLTTSPLMEWNKIFGIMILITDVTSIHHMHQREKAILTENNLLQRERYEGLQNISQAIAHQIRNPMMTIGGFAGLLLKRNRACTDEATGEYLECILSASRRLEEIVNAVSQFTALALGTPEPVDVRELLEESCAWLLDRARAQGLALDCDVRVEPARLVLDRTLMSTALHEILENSLEAMGGDSGRVAVRGSMGISTYLLVFSDNGAGIAQEHLPYLTDPFFTTKAVGVGMGLTNVERIVREHKGTLFVSSQPGRGSTVSLEIPLDVTAPIEN